VVAVTSVTDARELAVRQTIGNQSARTDLRGGQRPSSAELKLSGSDSLLKVVEIGPAKLVGTSVAGFVKPGVTRGRRVPGLDFTTDFFRKYAVGWTCCR
jgi:hypothetical protein